MLHDRTALTADEIIRAFHDAADLFLATVDQVNDWDAHGLGEWTVRELAAHTLRAFTTIEQYLAADRVTDLQLPDATSYFRAALADPAVHAAVAERGRAGARDLVDPPAEARATAHRVLAVVDSTDPDRIVDSFIGAIAFREYLAGRVVELTVHTTDIQAATGQPITAPASATRVALAVLAPLAEPVQLVRGITGRVAINVLG
jgi:uncharacterized protein (TIGR03083 family)